MTTTGHPTSSAATKLTELNSIFLQHMLSHLHMLYIIRFGLVVILWEQHLTPLSSLFLLLEATHQDSCCLKQTSLLTVTRSSQAPSGIGTKSWRIATRCVYSTMLTFTHTFGHILHQASVSSTMHATECVLSTLLRIWKRREYNLMITSWIVVTKSKDIFHS